MHVRQIVSIKSRTAPLGLTATCLGSGLTDEGRKFVYSVGRVVRIVTFSKLITTVIQDNEIFRNLILLMFLS